MKDRLYGLRKCVACAVVALLLFGGLAGCNKADKLNNKEVFTFGGRHMTLRQVKAYGYIFAHEHNLHDVEELKTVYEDDETYEAYYLQTLKDEIIDTLLLFDRAEDKNLTLTPEDKQQARDRADELSEAYGKNFLDNAGVDKSDLEDIYNMRSMAEAYKTYLAGDEEDTEIPSYIKVFQVTFSTVVVDDMGNMLTDEGGNVKKQPESVVSAKREQAEEFVLRINEGGDIAELLRDYDDTVTGADKYLKYDDLDDAYRRAVDGLRKGQVSGVFDAPYGFYVVKLLEEDCPDYAGKLTSYDNATAKEEKVRKELTMLRSAHIDNSTEYMDEELWNGISMADFIR